MQNILPLFLTVISWYSFDFRIQVPVYHFISFRIASEHENEEVKEVYMYLHECLSPRIHNQQVSLNRLAATNSPGVGQEVCPAYVGAQLRPLQFNYLSYELFWKKNPVRLQKKRKKSHLWCLTDESVFEIFCQTPKKKKKSASFKNILCKCDSINYRKLSLL